MAARPTPPTLITLGLLACLGHPASAQRPLPLGTGGPVVRLDVAKPLFDAGIFRDAHVASGVLDASLVLPLGGSMSLFGQLGISVGEIAGTGWSSTLSNPRLGAALGRERGLRASVYTDLPLAQEMGGAFASAVGRYTHFQEWARYGTQTWTVGASGSAEAELGPGAFVGARLDGTLLLPVEEAAGRDALGLVTFYGDAPTGSARLWIELSALALFTQPELSFSERSTFFGTVSLSLPVARFAPEAYVRIPLDENLSGVISFVLGVRAHLGKTRAGV